MTPSQNRVEFYKTGTTQPFYGITGAFNVPQVGHEIAVGRVMGTVVTVTWNLDFSTEGYPEATVWRANVYIKEF